MFGEHKSDSRPETVKNYLKQNTKLPTNRINDLAYSSGVPTYNSDDIPDTPQDFFDNLTTAGDLSKHDKLNLIKL